MCASEATAASGICAEQVLDCRAWRKAGAVCLVWRERVLLVRGRAEALDLRLPHFSVAEVPPLRSLSSVLTGMCVRVGAGICLSASGDEQEEEEEEEGKGFDSCGGENEVAAFCSCKARELLPSTSQGWVSCKKVSGRQCCKLCDVYLGHKVWSMNKLVAVRVCGALQLWR